MQLYTIIIVHTSRSSVSWAREPTPIQLLSCLIIYNIQIGKKKTHIQLLDNNNKKAKQDSEVHDTEENFV